MLKKISIDPPTLHDSFIIKGLIAQASLQNKNKEKLLTIKQVDDCWKEVMRNPNINPVFVAHDKNKFAGAALCSFLPVMHYGRKICQINDIVISKFSNFNQTSQYLLKYINQYSKKQNAFVVNLSKPLILSSSTPLKVPLTIKQCSLQHIPDIKYISEITFRETFSSQNTEEDMKKYCENNFNEKIINHEIQSKGSYFYLAEYEGKIIGYMKINFNPSQTEEGYPNSLEIQRIYISNKYKNLHVGSFLIDKAIEIAQSQNVDYIWLGVWEFNYAAQNFYVKKGFYKFGEHIFVLGNDKQIDFMMKLPLKPE